jgi:hypothetical protein
MHGDDDGKATKKDSWEGEREQSLSLLLLLLCRPLNH